MTGYNGFRHRFLALLLAVLLAAGMAMGAFAQEGGETTATPDAAQGEASGDGQGDDGADDDPDGGAPDDNGPANEPPLGDPVPPETDPDDSAGGEADGGEGNADPALDSAAGQVDPQGILNHDGAEPPTLRRESAAAIRMETDTPIVRAGQAFTVTAAFRTAQESNALTLTYHFEDELFEYEAYKAAAGSAVLDERLGDGWVTFVLMVNDYDLQDLGAVTLRAKKDAPLRREEQTVSLAVEYAALDKEGEDKLILTASAQVSFTTYGIGSGKPEVEGDTNDDGIVDMIDLSNIIDWFGFAEDRPNWDDWYIHFDFNENGEIDIQDIAHVARLIGSGGEGPKEPDDAREALRDLITEAEKYTQEDYTEESWASLDKALKDAKDLVDNEDATERQLEDARKALQEAIDALERIGDGDDDDDDDNDTDDDDDGDDDNDTDDDDDDDGGGNGGQTPGGGGSGNGSSGRDRNNGGAYYGSGSSRSTGSFGAVVITDPAVPLASLPDVQWIDRTQALSLLEAAGTGAVINRAEGTVGIRADALAALDGRRFHQDSLEGGVVQVRVSLDNPAQHESDLLLSGTVTGARAAAVKALFGSWYRNPVAVVALDQAGRFGAPVEIAARVSLDGMDTEPLCFYSYRQASNTYTELEDVEYWKDANGYLHFFTTQGDSIVISAGPLQKK